MKTIHPGHLEHRFCIFGCQILCITDLAIMPLEYSPSLRVSCILRVPDFKKSFKFTLSDRVRDENFVSSRISLLNGQTDTSVPGIWCGVYVLHGLVVFCLVWRDMACWCIYIYSPTVGAGIDERGVILAISTTRLAHFTLHPRHQDWKRGYAALRAVCLSKHVAHEGKEYNGGDTHYSPRDPRLWPLFRIEYWSISDCAPRRILR